MAPAPTATAQEEAEPATPRLTIFSLPLEIRQAIYLLALTPAPPADAIHHLTPRDIHVSLHLPRSAQAELRSANFWSSRSLQRRLRLLRAHSAVRDEASVVLYTRFTFSFPPWEDAFFFAALKRWLSAPVPHRATGIRSLQLSRSVTMAVEQDGPVERHWERQRRLLVPNVFKGPEDFQILGRHCGGLQRVLVNVRFQGFDVQDGDDREWLVQRVLALARPFRNVPSLVLRDFADKGSQREGIVVEARRRIADEKNWFVIPQISRAKPRGTRISV